jgi:hypothetical protein
MKHGLQRWRDNPIGFIERYLFDPTTLRPFSSRRPAACDIRSWSLVP